MRLTRFTCLAGATLVMAAAVAPLAGASATKKTETITAKLTVAATKPPSCSAGLCRLTNNGSGTLTHYGNVTFTTAVTFDTNQPPCGTGSQWGYRIVRKIRAAKGTLVLHEAGLNCPKPNIGPYIHAVWAVDRAASTGVFAGASGQGTDIAYPARNTAAPEGTITLVSR